MDEEPNQSQAPINITTSEGTIKEDVNNAEPIAEPVAADSSDHFTFDDFDSGITDKKPLQKDSTDAQHDIGELQKQDQTLVPPKRDYSKFDPEDAKILKTLHNRAFDYFSKRLLSVKQTEQEKQEALAQVKQVTEQAQGKILPSAWYEHPDAYMLAPDYQALNQKYDKISFESDHWQEQLIAIKEGRQWTRLLGYNRQSGQPVFSDPIDPSPSAEIGVLNAFNSMETAKQQIQSEALKLQTEFKDQYQQGSTFIDQALEKNIVKLMPELKPRKEQLDAFSQLMPKVYIGHPLLKLAANLFAIATNQANVISSLRGGVNSQAAIQQDKRRAGPGAIKTVGGAGKTDNNSEVIDFESIDKEFNS